MSSVRKVLGEMRRFLKEKEVAEGIEFELAQEVDIQDLFLVGAKLLNFMEIIWINEVCSTAV